LIVILKEDTFLWFL